MNSTNKQKHNLLVVLEEVLEYRKTTFSTLATYQWEKKVSKKITNYFSRETYIEDLTVKNMRDFFSSIRFKENGELMSTKYLKSVKTIMQAVFNTAMQDGYIDKDPLYKFKIPTGSMPNSTERLISKTDLEKLFIAIQEKERFKIIIPILLLTGMRIGELLALRWSSIDYENQIIRVKEAVKTKYIEKNGKVIHDGQMLGKPKTISSIREIPVNEQVLQLFDMWKEYLNKNPSVLKKQKENNLEDIIFVNMHGKLMCYNTLYKELKLFLKKHNLQHCGILFHKLRHCYATNLFDAGVDIDVISKLLGHSNIITTANFYVKVNLEPKVKAIQKLNKFTSQNYQFIDELYK
ncbi:site-specific integrase [Porcipelethomonas ammoniilytica]|uniref:tyrosine-type recombinase/integrase n=1 Tax=Porcipelethomonas ammoniilytica TaxID=2981722 RepID=UPI0008206E40|nr:site-specific integrase [Porcipelethomonas ammoniilytica]MCU6720692.1 site-specific integrase [Porcipelethomonas ammoniilytica]SCJ21816.1 Integrase [uncultured Ruminococcus sp.]